MNAVINNELLKMNLTQLNQMVSIINDIKVMKSKSSLSVGANVFVVQKTKRTPAVINKINQTRAVVAMKGKQYNVPFSMLEVA